MSKTQRFLSSLGPGLLYAGAAVGVSHLVQSTRAGAEYGWALVWAVIAANALKYPFFEFGPRYALATGKSLLEGYMKLGKWAFALFMFITFGTMFTIQATVTLVTAGLAGILLGDGLSTNQYAVVLLIICTLLLLRGRYSVLDKTIKLVIIALSVTSLIALIAAGYNYHPEKILVERNFDWSSVADITFLIALMGWMPAPIDIAVWHSLWTIEKAKSNPDLKVSEAKRDFHIGYWGTAILALIFVGLGALGLYGSGEEMPAQSVPFAAKLISMYTSQLGSWSFYIIAIAAFTTMFSTTLTVLDAYPRTVANGGRLMFPAMAHREIRMYAIMVFATAFGGGIILFFFSENMKALIQFATIISFVTAPLLALMNYLVMSGKDIPAEFKPNNFEKLICLLGGIFLISFSIFYVVKVL
jgi:Mn2+/Fe2+ NRAMP family transporter